MAKNYAKPAINVPEQYVCKAKKQYEEDWDVHRQYITTFDPLEAMLIGVVYDSVSNSVDTSKITDSYAATLAKERADRVMAKLPDGETESMGRADIGKAAFMDILRQKWMYPNANAQHSFQEKLNMWQLYSSVYGYMPMFYDWNISTTGYIGPDCWLWNPRNLVPQAGKASISDMEYVTALTWVSKEFLVDCLADAKDLKEAAEAKLDEDEAVHDLDAGLPENPVDNGGWDVDALRILIAVADNTSNPDANRDTKVTRERTPQQQRRGVCLATRYEAGEDGEWVTFAPDHGFVEVRRLKNPHKNGRIPFVIKYSQPLFDSFYGLGDFQRAKPLQFARDGLVNFYFKGIKMNLIPPLVANANGVLKHTLDYREGAVMLETIPNSIRRLETSTAGLATFQGAQDALTGSLLALYGSQNASLASGAAMNPSQGKTPQAIDLYADKEATRDGSERRHLEDSIQQLTNGFFSLVANIGTEAIPVALFAEDIKEIYKSGLKDVSELFTKKNFTPDASGFAATLKIDPKAFRGVEFRFKINQNSTAMANKQAQLQAMQDFLGTIGKFQNILTEDPRVTIHWDKISDKLEWLTDIPGASEFMSFDPSKPSLQEMQMQIQQAKAQTPSASSIQTPTGQVHELADLGKLYLNTDDWWVKNQILEAMGFQPAPPDVQAQITQTEPGGEKQQEPPAQKQPELHTISTGHSFRDPDVAAAAQAIHNFQPAEPMQPEQPPAPEPEPTVISTGHAFRDPTVAAAAEAINQTPTPDSMVESGQPANK